MRMSEILRQLADVIDSAAGGAPAMQQQQQVQTAQVATGSDSEQDQKSNTFVPPLQTKIELLKKSEGVTNVYDGKPEQELTVGETGQQDELEVVKKNAGISSIAKQEMADDDGPFEG